MTSIKKKVLKTIIIIIAILLIISATFCLIMPLEKYEDNDCIVMINPITKKCWACKYEKIENSYDMFISEKYVGTYIEITLLSQDDQDERLEAIELNDIIIDKSEFTTIFEKKGRFDFFECCKAIFFNKNIKV